MHVLQGDVLSRFFTQKMSLNLTGDPSTHWLLMLSLKPRGILLLDIREEQDGAQESFQLWIFSIWSKGRIQSCLLQLDKTSFPECFPSFGCSSVRSRACQDWAPLDYCAKTQTGHCSQVKLELEESVYTLKTVPLFSLAGAANKTSLLLLCSALRVLSLPLFKGLKMLLTSFQAKLAKLQRVLGAGKEEG